MVSLEARKGTCELRESRARMHSLSAKRLVLMEAPSMRRCLLLLWQSAARSEPAKSTKSSFPYVFPLVFFTLIWQMAWERDEVSLAAVQRVVRELWP